MKIINRVGNKGVALDYSQGIALAPLLLTMLILEGCA